MATFEIKQGDTSPAFVGRCLDGRGRPVPTLGASVALRMRPQVEGLRPAIYAAAVWSDPDRAEAAYHWGQDDTAVPGLYDAEFHVGFADGSEGTFPAGEYVTVEILPAAEGPAGSPPSQGSFFEAGYYSGSQVPVNSGPVPWDILDEGDDVLDLTDPALPAARRAGLFIVTAQIVVVGSDAECYASLVMDFGGDNAEADNSGPGSALVSGAYVLRQGGRIRLVATVDPAATDVSIRNATVARVGWP